jgi:catechol 2,3-dioxygenase-like lactoylglutathione lyase family enzyme
VIHFYRVADLEKQRSFYQTVLGLSVYKDQGQCLIFNVNDQSKIGFCTHHPRAVKDDTCITFVFETLEALKAIQDHLQRHGVSSEPIEHNETFKIRHFFVRDPAQHLLEFQMFIES